MYMKKNEKNKKRIRRGRPPVDPALKLHQAATRYTDAERALIQQKANEEGITLSEAIRKLSLHGAAMNIRSTQGVTAP